jgi:hypothetical protein
VIIVMMIFLLILNSPVGSLFQFVCLVTWLKNVGSLLSGNLVGNIISSRVIWVGFGVI